MGIKMPRKNNKIKKGNFMNIGHKLIVGAIGFLIFIAVAWNFFAGIKIEGNQIGVIQDWQKGVLDKTLSSGTHFYNNLAQDIYVYDIGTQKITFDSFGNKDAEWPAIDVEIGENGGQKASISISCNYRLNPVKVVEIHKAGLGKSYESVVLKREIVDTVNEIARPHPSALDLYSGAGFVKFKNDVDKALHENTFLKEKGIDVENTIIYQVHLDPEYEKEIAGKQLAQQQKLRKQEETKAAEEEAKRIFAMSQANVEKVRQEAEAQKIITVKNAEAQAEQQVLQADAEKKKRIALAEGERDANLALASGILAVGQAEAQVAQLKSQALYAGEAGAKRAQVEIATKQAEMVKGILSGVQVLPEKALIQLGRTAGVAVSEASQQ
jgi:regulator of protease activity HflC (stomatin/prohibitin superfamily)